MIIDTGQVTVTLKVCVCFLWSLVRWFGDIYLSFRPVNVIDSCEEFLSCFLVDVGSEADVDQVSQLLHRVLPVVLDELLHVILSKVVCLDVGLYELLVWNWSEVSELLQLHQELLEVQLHQRTSFITAFLHICIALH